MEIVGLLTSCINSESCSWFTLFLEVLFSDVLPNSKMLGLFCSGSLSTNLSVKVRSLVSQHIVCNRNPLHQDSEEPRRNCTFLSDIFYQTLHHLLPLKRGRLACYFLTRRSNVGDEQREAFRGPFWLVTSKTSNGDVLRPTACYPTEELYLP